MVFDEFLEGLYILEESFQDKGWKISDKERSLLIWFEMFKDDSANVFMHGIKRFLATSKFAPTIAALRECIQEATNPTAEITADDAWGEVRDAIRGYGSYNEVAALESMTPMVRQIVKAMGYRSLCLSETPMVDRAHFLKMFDQYKARDKKDYLLPSSVKDEMKQIQGEFTKTLMDKMTMPTVSGVFERGTIDPSIGGEDGYVPEEDDDF